MPRATRTLIGDVVRVAAPLCITEAEAHESVDRPAAALDDILS